MAKAVDVMAERDNDFAAYKNQRGGNLHKRQYNILYNITKRFTDEYVGPTSDNQSGSRQKFSQEDEEMLFGSDKSAFEELN